MGEWRQLMGKRVTIADVAREAGVSISSVSVALNGGPGVSEETRARIAEVARSTGWVPSVRGRSLSGNRAFALGLVLQRKPEVLEADPFFAGFIGGVESILERRDFALVLQLASSRSGMIDRCRRLALARRIDGMFLTDIRLRDPRIPLLAMLGLPTVAINAGPGCPFPTVRQDPEPGMRDLMAHLVGLGHRRIAHVSGGKGMIHSAQRLKAWRRGLDAAGLPHGPVVQGDFTSEGGSRAADELLSLPEPPTAVVCANDLTAIGFIARATEIGFHVPHQVSVTGYDGIQLGSFMRPPLTTLLTSPHGLGRAAAGLLLDLIDGKPVTDVEIQPASLIIRGSTAAPPA
ncbi:DNA-binding LacI/PurR family transcriptional regulator [Microlunatus panaciterrae]|uniref:DNA-binding LacI/PurR family transcriptional regulator n=1 Tax=Microlunatus panaciterrae TaxID=400768 RepID=A0ABS2REQ5_9ACTN|nr:LacI family DNA-binding transcriptional regulator [Microlunatus panaciterrae]MBM7797469.1 DNA-binding LacI/PurR family transcriptional regulator [Microlunatus panaciterrae]